MTDVKNNYEEFYSDEHDYSRRPEDDLAFFEELFKIINVNTKSRILELGCGTGYNLELIQKLGYSNLHGTDFSENAIQASVNKLGSSGIKFQQLDTFNMEFDNKFDVIFAIGHSPFNTESKEIIQKLIKIIANTIIPGGYFVFVHSSDYSMKWVEGVVEPMFQHNRKNIKENLNYSGLFSDVKVFSIIRPLSVKFKPILLSLLNTVLSEIAIKLAPIKNVNGRLIAISKKK